MWRKIIIKGNSKTAEVWQAIQDSFEAIFIATGAPEDAAMYFSSEVPGQDVTIYLTPGAVKIFDGSGGEVRPARKPDSAGLLVGHAGTRHI